MRAQQTRTSSADARTIHSLQAGDERTFRLLVDRHGPLMQRVAQLYVRNQDVAEEVVQDAWVGILRGIDRFEARSSLKTWMFRILTNIARRRADQERRSIPLSSLLEAQREGSVVAVERFLRADREWPGHWARFPHGFADLPEAQLVAGETLAVAHRSISALPPNQRTVIGLRDVHGWPATEVCELLDISEANQRVLLHRARTKVRRALQDHLTDT